MLVEQPHGGALQIGNPGNRGGTGRPPNVFRQRMREALEEAKGVEFLVAVVQGKARAVVGMDKGELVEGPPRFPDKLEAVGMLIEHGHGKAPQKLEVEGDGGAVTGAWRDVLELARAVIEFDREDAKARRILTSGRVVE